MENALNYSHTLLTELIDRFPSGNYIDATIGKGFDSEFILSLSDFKGYLYGFDIQEIAINMSKERLENNNKINSTSYQLFNDSHATIDKHIAKDLEIHGAIFNLGYLPGANHQITTQYWTTISATEQIINKLVHKGQIIYVVYWGHSSGKTEKIKLYDFVSSLSQKKFDVVNYRFLNQRNNPPEVIIIERK